MISFSHVYKTYDENRHALRDLNLTINPQDFIFLTGESGAGKTTLFRLLIHQERITTGKLIYNNNDMTQFKAKQIADYRKKIGIVFQDFKLVKELSIFENVALPLRIQKIKEIEIKKRVLEILISLEINELSSQFPDFVSGGEKQRIAIARAMVTNPDIVLADEPTGNLDKKNSDLVINLFEKLSDQGKTVIIVTHDENLVRRNEQRNNFRHVILEKGEIKNQRKMIL